MNDPLTEKVIGAAFRVHNTLGFGYLESIYQKSLSIELTKADVSHKIRVPLTVYYDQYVVGEFECDLLVDQRLIVQVRSVTETAKVDEVQLVNYLVATRVDDGLLLNFGPSRVDVKRKFRVYRKSNSTG